MDFVERQKFIAKEKQKRLILPEGYEPRTVEAARRVLDEKLAGEVTLLGSRKEIEAIAFERKVSLEGLNMIDPNTSDKLNAYAQEYFELRKSKGVTLEEAKMAMRENISFGAMMVRMGDGDAIVAGADHATKDVLLAGFQIIKTAPGIKYASSCFIMDFPNRQWGADGLMVFADCATIIEPTAEQLCEIAIAACDSCKTHLRVEPICAMLSFSTYGSASHPNVDKVTQALAMIRAKRPDLNVDGEMQLDAAIIPEVAKNKAPSSSVAGKANTLVFPDLQSGNIGYKIAQRFGGAGAYGPLMQGFAKPISDLSRGAGVDDIVNTCAIELAQAI